nr:helix-turn-helix transcriptional regulator [Oscillospiraceae bacterium]
MNRIRQLRRQKNMTQQDVGQALGVGNTAVSMYENEQRRLDDDLIRN